MSQFFGVPDGFLAFQDAVERQDGNLLVKLSNFLYATVLCCESDRSVDFVDEVDQRSIFKGDDRLIEDFRSELPTNIQDSAILSFRQVDPDIGVQGSRRRCQKASVH
ncbi:MAG: hypothetical protein M2R45_01989 [Verrucomicrobia subdivision 3 bacterium]|nr:hypothetical protein [Limisphaerales bacterium]MCS1414807.1 hypothetical protein [Limisphaerales bacterium]